MVRRACTDCAGCHGRAIAHVLAGLQRGETPATIIKARWNAPRDGACALLAESMNFEASDFLIARKTSSNRGLSSVKVHRSTVL